jgi:hypothetical protein
MGLAVGRAGHPKYLRLEDKTGLPRTRIHSVRPARRVAPNGSTEADLVMEIIQTRDVPFDESDPKGPTFKFRGGCTLLIDRDRHEVRWCIAKSIYDEDRLERERAFRTGEAGTSLHSTYFGDPRVGKFDEPFALLHRTI